MRHKRVWIFLGFMVLVLILNHIFGWSDLLIDPEHLPLLPQVLHENFALALLLYLLLVTAACVFLALPGVTFAIAAGLLFGPLWGTLACWAAATLGACLAFLAGRYFLKDSIKPKLRQNKQLDKLLFHGAGQSDLFLLMLTRLVPLFPYNLQNFAYGVTDISFAHYALYSALFLLPGTAVYTVGAAGMANGEHRVSYLLFAGGLFAVVMAVSLLLKKRVLRDGERGERI